MLATLCGGLLLAAVLQAPPTETTWRGPDGRPLPFAGHEQALDFLRRATVIESEEIEGSQNRPLRVVLEDGGVRARAVFRSVDRIWRREWIRERWYLHLIDRATSERAAYVVARLLGFDNIPPTVLREIGGERGSLQLWLEGMQTQSELSAERAPIPPDWADQRAAIWVFDNLLFNVDRHPGNLLLDDSGKLWMIDHTQTFQYDERLLEAEQVHRVPRHMWERLRAIDEARLGQALQESLDDDQIDALLKRRRLLIEHIEGLIAERGAGLVLFDVR